MNRLIKIAALLLCLLLSMGTLTACGGKNKKAVGSCNGQEILYEELRYRTLLYREAHPNCTEEELRAGVEQELKQYYALLLLAAEHIPEASIDSKEMNELIDETVNGIRDSLGGKDPFQNYLSEQNLTEPLMRRLLAMTELQLRLEKKLYAGTELESKEALLAWLENGNYVRARKLFVPLTDAAGSSLQETAFDIRASLLEGADPDSLITASLAAAGADCYKASYFFRNLDGDATEAAALALAVGGISEVITTEKGYVILIRVEDNRQALVDYQLPTLYDRYCADRTNALCAEKAKELTVTWNDYGSSLTLTEID